MQLHRIRALRRVILPLLRKVDLDVTIRHHWTSGPVRLNVFKHKGYWYHGRKREFETMQLFGELLGRGDFVLEVGGHIGYVSLHLWHQIGPTGQLIVFEPSPKNLPYIRHNLDCHPGIRVVEQAAADFVGSATFYEEELTGQNSTLIKNYSVFDINRRRAHAEGTVRQQELNVSCITIDEFLRQECLRTPSLVKIDVEGAEYMVLSGMKTTLDNDGIALMVEVTERSDEVLDLLESAGYLMFHPDKRAVTHSRDVRGNIFCLKASDKRIRKFERA